MPKVSEEHRAARREQILSAALRCAVREGFHKTTMSAVIRESALSAGAVYLYFPSKQVLIRAVAEHIIRRLAEAFSDLAAQRPVPAPEEALAAAAGAVLTVGDTLGVDLPRLALQAWAEAARDPAVREVFAVEAAGMRQAWVRYAEHAIADGHLRPDADAEAVGRGLMTMMPGFLLSRTMFGDTTPEEYVAGLAELRRPHGAG